MHDDTAMLDRGGRARMRCLIAIGLAVGGMVSFYKVAAKQDNQGYAVFGFCWVALGMASVALALRSIARKDFGSAAAWVTCALPLFAVATCLSFALMFTTDA